MPTIHQYDEITSAASNDELLIWRAANGDTRKITKANLIGATLTGGGTIVTNGKTLTVPETGTAALLGEAQTFSAAKTFSATATFSGGLKFANETMQTYRRKVTMSPAPVIMGSEGDPTINYGTQEGTYWKIDELVFLRIRLGISTITGGGGTMRISLPFPVGAQHYTFAVSLIGVNVPDNTVNVTFEATNGQSYGLVFATIDNAARESIKISDLGNGDLILLSGFYEAAS